MRCHLSHFLIRFRICHATLRFSQFHFAYAMPPFAFPNSVSHMRCRPSLFSIPFRLCDSTLRFSQSRFAYAMAPFAFLNSVSLMRYRPWDFSIRFETSTVGRHLLTGSCADTGLRHKRESHPDSSWQKEPDKGDSDVDS